MKIDVLARDGSPLHVSMATLWGDGNRVGVGGAEYGILTLCEGWTGRGHDVVFYNDAPGGSVFEHRSRESFNPFDDRDVLIVLRSPNPHAIVANGLKVWLSMDQYTIDSFADFSEVVDKIVCISPFHVEYFKNTYGIENAIPIDLPVRTQDFDELNLEKVPKSVIFNSVPTRGLEYMRQVWGIVHSNIPDSSLVITSDFRLWGVASAGNEDHKVRWIGSPNVQFYGALPRKDLLFQQAKAQIHAYPCVYEELFCIAIAETSCMGAYPISNDIGALATTNMGRIIPGNPALPGYVEFFAEHIIELLEDQEKLLEESKLVKEKAMNRFNLDKVLDVWEKEVFNGL